MLSAYFLFKPVWDSRKRSILRWLPPQHGAQTQWLSVAAGLVEKRLRL